MSLSSPPKPEELEISIIGPGRGECVVLHLGHNEWCVVDSCIPRGKTESAAVEYLRGLGNDALEGIRLIVATHWHDDHIRGLGSILKLAPTASFFCSAALEKEIFLELVQTAATGIPTQSGVDEFALILGAISDNRPSERIATPKWAIENRRLLHLKDNGRLFPAVVTALSPSDNTLALALAEISKLLPKTGDPQHRIPNLTPNHASVALWIEVGSVRALLGGDLLHTGHEGEGWTAVLSSHQDASLATLFKVPHHGSQNADCPEVWDKMLEKDPIAVITPFNRGVPLPQESDLRRLTGRTTRLYCTAGGAGKEPVRDAVVEKMMRRYVTERRVVEGQPGHVRVRWSVDKPGNPPTVELFNGAYLVTPKKFAA